MIDNLYGNSDSSKELANQVNKTIRIPTQDTNNGIDVIENKTQAHLQSIQSMEEIQLQMATAIANGANVDVLVQDFQRTCERFVRAKLRQQSGIGLTNHSDDPKKFAHRVKKTTIEKAFGGIINQLDQAKRKQFVDDLDQFLTTLTTENAKLQLLVYDLIKQYSMEMGDLNLNVESNVIAFFKVVTIEVSLQLSRTNLGGVTQAMRKIQDFLKLDRNEQLRQRIEGLRNNYSTTIYIRATAEHCGDMARVYIRHFKVACRNLESCLQRCLAPFSKQSQNLVTKLLTTNTSVCSLICWPQAMLQKIQPIVLEIDGVFQEIRQLLRTTPTQTIDGEGKKTKKKKKQSQK